MGLFRNPFSANAFTQVHSDRKDVMTRHFVG